MSNEKGMSLIVKTVTRLTFGLIIIYGIYIVLRGHISPGGGFAGGVIITLSFILLMLAFGKDNVLKKLNQSRCLTFSSLGALIFLFIATAGFINKQKAVGGKEHFAIFGAGLIPLCDIAVSVMVGTGLFLMFFALVLLVEEKEGK
ncbi:MAG: hypothetical protein NTW13_04170 [Candidatus Omnitrophica bacterium]|nr:hypothetical protein [Candidatus Omnitrophota bacterium]